MSYILCRSENGSVWVYAEVTRSSGPERTITNAEPDPTFRHRPVGFVAPATEKDPLTWDGDGA